MQRQWLSIFNVRKKEKVVRRYLLIFLSVLSTVSYSEGEFASLPEVQLEVSAPQQLTVGDGIDLHFSEGVTDVQSLDVPAGSSPLKDLGWRISKSADGKIKAYALRAGELSLPSLEVKNSQGQGIARTQALKFTVQSAISSQDPKPKEPEGLRPPMALPFPVLVAVLLGSLLALLLAGLAYGFYKWRKNRKDQPAQVEPVIQTESEDELALRALLALEKQGWHGQGRNKELVFSISEILKKYLSSRYSFDASESTSEEILETSEKRSFFDNDTLDSLELMLSELDGIKFTDVAAETDQCLEILKKVRKFILKTRRGMHEIR